MRDKWWVIHDCDENVLHIYRYHMPYLVISENQNDYYHYLFKHGDNLWKAYTKDPAISICLTNESEAIETLIKVAPTLEDLKKLYNA